MHRLEMTWHISQAKKRLSFLYTCSTNRQDFYSINYFSKRISKTKCLFFLNTLSQGAYTHIANIMKLFFHKDLLIKCFFFPQNTFSQDSYTHTTNMIFDISPAQTLHYQQTKGKCVSLHTV